MGALFVYSNSGRNDCVFDLSLASTDDAGAGGLTASPATLRLRLGLRLNLGASGLASGVAGELADEALWSRPERIRLGSGWVRRPIVRRFVASRGAGGGGAIVGGAAAARRLKAACARSRRAAWPAAADWP